MWPQHCNTHCPIQALQTLPVALLPYKARNCYNDEHTRSHAEVDMLRFTLAGGHYDRTQALIDGEVKPSGAELTYLPMRPPEIFRRMLRYLEFDGSEMSMSSLLIGREQGIPLVAIPVFPSRKFRHSYIFCNVDAGIREPQDLIGKRVGAREYQLTANLWIRGILKHEYDVEAKDIRWFTEWEERIPVGTIEGVTVRRIPEGKTLDGMLINGEIDALIWPNIPNSVRRRSAKVRRLFEDYPRVEAEYYKKTGLFPIMHTVVLKRDVYERNPWLAVSLLEAYREAKERCFRQMDDPSAHSLVWFEACKEEQHRVFGSDPYPYNIRENRKVLETIIQYSVEQGLTKSPFSIEDLFAKNTLDA